MTSILDAVSTTAEMSHAREALSSSRLARAGGAVLTRLLDAAQLSSLREEAFECHARSHEIRVHEHDGEECRGGNPDRWLETSPGGPALYRLFHAPATLSLLRYLTGLQWLPSGDVGTFSYYRRPGHYIGLHRDIEECDLAIITCVHDSRMGDAPSGGPGSLVVYFRSIETPLSVVRRQPSDAATYVRLDPGQSLVLLGGRLPHRIVPVAEGQLRIVAPLCFQIPVGCQN